MVRLEDGYRPHAERATYLRERPFREDNQQTGLKETVAWSAQGWYDDAYARATKTTLTLPQAPSPTMTSFLRISDMTG